MNKIPVNLALIKLNYDSNTGVFTRKSSGKIAGTLSPSGYIKIGISNKIYRAHRVAWAIWYGDTEFDIDHIDGNKSNNSILNLRLVTDAQNSQNVSRSHSDSLLGTLGVSFNKNKVNRKFRASIMVNGSAIRKSFYTKKEASNWYKQKKREIHPFSTI